MRLCHRRRLIFSMKNLINVQENIIDGVGCVAPRCQMDSLQTPSLSPGKSDHVLPLPSTDHDNLAVGVVETVIVRGLCKSDEIVSMLRGGNILGHSVHSPEMSLVAGTIPLPLPNPPQATTCRHKPPVRPLFNSSIPDSPMTAPPITSSLGDDIPLSPRSIDSDLELLLLEPDA